MSTELSSVNTMNNFGFIKVAATVPPLKVANPDYNVGKIIEFAKRASKEGAKIIVFPELSVSGYTTADLFHQRTLLEKATESLNKIKIASKEIKSILIVGAPIECDGKLLNTAVVVFGGQILGIVPKTYLPGYKEFYEERWFASARDLITSRLRSRLQSNDIPIGTDLLFRVRGMPEAMLGIEICEDLWVPIPPSSYQALAGATIIANLSGSNELVAKSDYRRALVIQQSAKNISGYIYAGSGVHESTTDLVFSGHAIIAENGGALAESKKFVRAGEIITSEIDIDHLILDRARTTSFSENIHETRKKEFRIIEIPLAIPETKNLSRKIDSYPFVPQNPAELDKRSEEVFAIQSAGLAKRLEYSGIKKVVLGLSGGLDSALTLLVATKTFDLLSLPRKNIHAFTMPGFATSKRTKSNAVRLAKALGANLETIDISSGVEKHLRELAHNSKEDVTYQNAQARYRTMILMNKSNQINALMVGTGDLSEIALGWNTFSGDHISHYNVNAGVPKTLVRYLVSWISKQERFSPAQKTLKDILDTPISPELVRNHKKEITQKTENLIGPYALHDFFLYHFVRWGSSPSKILYLAKIAFAEKFKEPEIKKWLKVFLERFFKNQWKRSVMPDGPKIGSVALSPRGDWRMPSDADVKIWLDDLK